MSKFHEVRTQFKDRESLVEALADLGYTKVEVHDVAQSLYGYKGDRRAEKANVIVRRQFVGSASNDIGFVQHADGTFGAVISEYDSRRHNAAWVTSLTKCYAEKAALKQAKRLGFKVVRKEQKNGKTQIQLVR